ncbi:hypothetical protein [Streptomyces shaanxiensis]|uniref:Aconitase A/isopropylmalate dehydratase small subunit swivel domain-containing protein n=1 Tax=Streptomyces shaanxiensis TaxID=653357 RepID=A0ABP7V3V4_9ACTN
MRREAPPSTTITAPIRKGTQAWQEIEAPGGTRFPWHPESTYVRRPPHLTNLSAHPPAEVRIDRARILLRLGDNVTTDHISPAGAIPAAGAAGQWLAERGVARRDLNQYSTRRSNHEVMLRGAFTNAAVTNLLLDEAPPGPGGHAYTADGTHILPVHQAAPTYREAGYDLVVVAGRNYGASSSRDWAAKAQALLGVRAVIAGSYERIHRSNLIGRACCPWSSPRETTRRPTPSPASRSSPSRVRQPDRRHQPRRPAPAGGDGRPGDRGTAAADLLPAGAGLSPAPRHPAVRRPPRPLLVAMSRTDPDRVRYTSTG